MSTWLALIIFLIVVVVVWWALTRRAKEYKPDFEVHTHEEEISPVVAEAEAAPATRATAIPTVLGTPDDLTILEGIGPKVNRLLQDAGIQTFAQLAAAPISQLEALLESAGLQFMNPGSWAEQAELAAEGKFDELKALTDSLKGGRRVN